MRGRRSLSAKIESQAWLKCDLESVVVGHAVANLVPIHIDEVRKRREDLATRTMAAVKDRLTKENTYLDHRANSGTAPYRADELQARLQRRIAEHELERQISPQAPAAIGGAIVVPNGLVDELPASPAKPHRRKPESRWNCSPCRWS